MNVQEGARRMQRAGQWLVMIPLTLVTLIWAVMFTVSLVNHSFFGPNQLVFLLILFYLVVPGGALWLAGWIVEGFANKDS
jgi:hypothetical protein